MGQEKLGLLLYQARGECYRPDHLQLLFLDGRLPFKICHSSVDLSKTLTIACVVALCAQRPVPSGGYFRSSSNHWNDLLVATR